MLVLEERGKLENQEKHLWEQSREPMKGHGSTCTICTMSHMVGRKNKRTNHTTMFAALKDDATAGYQGPVKIELLKGSRLPKNIQEQFLVPKKSISTEGFLF